MTIASILLTTALSSSAETKELVLLDEAMQRAVVDRDAAAFGRFLTEDYVLVDSKGALHGKAEVVAGITSNETKVEVNESSEAQVRVQGDTAVLIAVLHQRGLDHGVPYDVPVRFTDTWIRRGGKWLCMSGHATRLPK